MPRGKGLYDDEDADEPKGGRPGSADHGREGGMATRENAPDLTTSREQPGAAGLKVGPRLGLRGCAADANSRAGFSPRDTGH